VLAWLADLRPAFAMVAVGASWFLVALIEWLRWRVAHGSQWSGGSS
jgi:hypothetical protein